MSLSPLRALVLSMGREWPLNQGQAGAAFFGGSE